MTQSARREVAREGRAPSLGRWAERAAEAIAVFARPWSPWRDLAARLFLAQGFLVAGAMRMMEGSPALSGMASPALAGVAASDLGALVQLGAPVLLALGLFSRLAAGALLVQLALLPASAPGAAGFWAALLAWVVVSGPGRLSIDAMLTPALRGSAFPGAMALGRASAWVSPRLGPPLLAALRLWIAAVLCGAALARVGLTHAMVAAAGDGWLPMPPAMLGRIAPAVVIALAGLLVFGLGVRFVSLILLLAVPWGGLMATDERVFWFLLVFLPLIEGAGVLSLDGVIAARLRRAFPRVRDLTSGELARLPHVVVVGGGFGGTATARALEGDRCRITLIDQRNFTLFQPLLYQVATAGLSPADIATPIRSLFRRQANVRVLLGEVTGVDHARREVRMGDARIDYDWLVLATGARHAYFGRDDWAPFAPGLKQVEDATEIRRRILSAFEAAERTADAEERRAWLTFLVIGGGPTGVELAGAIAELSSQSLSDEFRTADPRTARVILVQAEDRVLPTFPPKLSAAATRSLRDIGVQVLAGKRVTAVDADGAVVGGERIAARTALWAAGVMASPAGAWVGGTVDRAGRLRVGPDLSLPGHPEVFAIGDTAASDAWDGKPVPGLAPAAKQGGHYVARVIRARLTGRPPPPPFRYRHEGSLATIGRQAAVADFGWLRLHGAVAWWLWGTVHVAFLLGGRNRLAVMIEWMWDYLTFRRSTRLITGHPADRGGQ